MSDMFGRELEQMLGCMLGCGGLICLGIGLFIGLSVAAFILAR